MRTLSDGIYEVESSSHRGHYYRVTSPENNPLGVWACSCVGWTHHSPRHDCKHITEVKQKVNA